MDKNVSTYKNGRLIRKSVIAPLLLLVVTFNLQLFAQKQNPEELSDFFDMSLEQLMDVPINTAASRLPYETGELSSPVTIITAKDIHHSGLTSIPEILRFYCGIDVLKIDRRRYAIGIHGLHENLSDRTTLLISKDYKLSQPNIRHCGQS